MCNYYAKLVPQYTCIATLLYNVLQESTKFNQTIDCDTEFNQLKHALVHPPVLTMPDFDANSVVEIDTSDVAVVTELIQHDQPVAFISKALNSAQCNHNTMDCKFLVIVLACKRWHPYQDGKKTVVLIDHKPLIGIHAELNLDKR